jgi:hypothetical protein
MGMVREALIRQNRTCRQKNMKLYKVFKHPAGGTKVIPEGWNWMAFLFGSLWTFSNELWPLGIGLLAGALALSVVVAEMTEQGASAVMNIVMIITAIVLASNGNAWRAASQSRKGYVLVDTVIASDSEAALATVFPNGILHPQTDVDCQA